MADLNINLFGIEFPNPIWTAAGPAAADAGMLGQAAEGGAGGLVTKTISLKPARVPVPNISSPSAGSLLNTELWSEMDYKQFIHEELSEAAKIGIPLIVSVGYSSHDLAVLGKELEKAAVVDAVEFSIHYIGKDVENLRKTAQALKDNISVPVLAKLSPAIQNLQDVIPALDGIVDGYVAVNSLGPALDFDIETLKPALGSKDGRGWLSGKAILPVGLHYVEAIARLTDKPVIGVGGIRTCEDVIKYIMAGASAVQVCSLAILKGQGVYGRLATELSEWMDTHHYRDIREFQGLYRHHKRRQTFYSGEQLFPEINYKLCTFCGLCEKSCIHKALNFKDKTYILYKEKCVSCGLCVSLCPKKALSLKISKG